MTAPSRLWKFRRTSSHQNSGPVTEQHLIELCRTGTLTLASLVSCEELNNGEWFSVARIPKLVDAIAAFETHIAAKNEQFLITQPTEQQKPEADRSIFLPRINTRLSRGYNRPGQREGNQSFHPQRILVLVTSLLGIAGTALPWANLPIVGSVNGLFVDGKPADGLFVIPLFLPAFAICFTGPMSRPIGTGRAFIGALFAFGASALGGYKVYDFMNAINSIGSDGNPIALAMRATVQPGFGLYLIIGAGVVTACILLAFAGSRKS